MNRVTFYTDIKSDDGKAAVEKACMNQNLYKDFEVDYKHPRCPATFTLNNGVQPSQVQKLIKEAGYKAEVVEKTGSAT